MPKGIHELIASEEREGKKKTEGRKEKPTPEKEKRGVEVGV